VNCPTTCNSCNSCCSTPCGCKKTTTTTSTTIPIIPCEVDNCEQIIDTECVVYDGGGSSCYGVTYGDSLNKVFVNIFEKVSTENCSCNSCDDVDGDVQNFTPQTSRLVYFKINSLGDGLGPTFILSDNFGLTLPYEFTRQQLLSGVNITININATEINVRSTGLLCRECCNCNLKKYSVPPTPTTTTSTTSTTTIPPIEICIVYAAEAFGFISCSTIQEPSLFNGKVYFHITEDSCPILEGAYGSDYYLYWKTSRWEFGDNLGNSGVAPGSTLISILENPGPYPVSTDEYEWTSHPSSLFNLVYSSLGECCLCAKIQYPFSSSYNGIYIDCDGNEQEYVIGEAGEPYTYVCTPLLQSIVSNPQLDPPSIYLSGDCVKDDDTWVCVSTTTNP
jgi:hypothetical protein